VELVVGVDIATAEVRAIASDATGKVHAEGRADLPQPSSPHPGWSEQDPRSWWPATAGALGRLTARLGSRAASVAALSISSTSGTVVALDAGGEPIGAALTYADQRAAAQALIAQASGEDRWRELGLTIQPSFGLAKWGWLVASPAASGKIRRLAHASDLVAAGLIGHPAPTDWSHALKSGYDPIRGEWAVEATSALGIHEHLLPEVLRPTEAAGIICAEAAAATGLPQGCLVRLGMTDSCASQLAAGAGSPGGFLSVLGSTLVLKGASRALVTDPAGAVYSHRHPQGWWLPGGASSSGGRCLTIAFGHQDLAALDRQAAIFGPANTVIYPLPGRGERFPFVAPEAERFSLGEPRSAVERFRALLEGVAFVERLGYEKLSSLGIEIEPPIRAAGRGSSSEVWNRIRATVLGVPLLAVTGASTARGACILAAAGTLHPDLQSATEAMSASGEPVEPNPSEKDALEESYGRFVDEVVERGWTGSFSPSWKP
jgi:sugar (pentulose or hexulose) kinase